MSSTGSLGSITRIVPVVASTTVGGTPVRRTATLAEFFTAIGAQAPDGLVRALGDDFFFGIHVVDKNAPMLIIPVTSYDRAFAGMLTWEKTIDSGLAPIFMAVPPLTTDANGLPVVRSFKDVIMRNYDVRILTDDNGSVVLYYSFPNPKILIIAESPYSFPEILSRLRAGRRL